MALDGALREKISGEILDLAASQVGKKRNEVTLQTRLVSGLAYDSLDQADFIMNLQERYERHGVQFQDEVVQRLGSDPSIESLVNYICENYKTD